MATPGVLLRRNLPAAVVLLVVHYLYSLVERLGEFFRRFSKRTAAASIPACDEEDSCWQNRLGREVASVEYGVRGLAKIPAHLVVMLGPEVPDYRQLARFLCWGLAAGVGHVSFYDHRGTLKRNHHRVLEHMVRLPRADSDQIVWTPQLKPGLPIPPRNGYRRRLVVSFFSPLEDGRGQLVQSAREISRELCDGKIASPEDITIETVDRKQRQHFRDVPDPDLAVYYGAVCCTYGLLPWQIRLTEFVQVRAPSLRDTGPDHLVDCLFRFAKCQQRFGK